MKTFKRTPFRYIFLFVVFSSISTLTHAQEETTPLIEAVKANDLANVKKLIAAGTDVNEWDDNFQRPLEVAIQKGRLDIVQVLVESGAEDHTAVSTAVEYGNVPIVHYLVEAGFNIGEAIVYAVEDNDIKMATYLAEHGAEVDFSQKRKTGLFKKQYVTPIAEAAALENLEMIQLLIKHGVNKKDALTAALNFGQTDLVLTLSKDFDDKNWLLLEAFSRDNDAVVSALFRQGILPNVKNDDGNTLLFIAVMGNNLTRVQKCVEEYKLYIHETNLLGETALMKAAEVGSVPICEYLLAKGISINAQNNKGETALFYALTDQTRAAFDFLVEKGADIAHLSSDGNSLLIKSAMDEHDQMVSHLISIGANIHHKNKENKTAFFYIVSNSRVFSGSQIIENTFIASGAPIDTKGSNGETLLFKAVENDQLERVQFLIEKGANANTTNDKGERPGCENFAVIRYLIEHGADINAVDDWNNTFMCVAVEENDLELAYYLIDKKIDVNKNCYFEEPPIIKAVKEGNLTLVKFLADNGANVNAIGYFNQNVMDYAKDIENQPIIDYLRSKGAMTKEERNEHYERTMELESEIKSALIAEDLDHIVTIMASQEVIVLQQKTVQDIAFVAAKKAHTPMINKLLSGDVEFDINSPVNDLDQTLLTIATIYSQDDLILDLLAKGANSELLDKNNKKPQDYATKKATEKIFKNWGRK
jgi:ankyrin repeat protein